MKTLNTILKGILLWSTGIATLVVIMSIETISLGIIVLDIIAILATINALTEEEFKKLSGYNLYMSAFK